MELGKQVVNTLSYLKTWDGYYRLYTTSREVVKSLNYVPFQYNSRRKHFEALVQYLPDVKGMAQVTLKAAKVRPPAAETHRKIETQYERVEAVRATIERAQKDLEREENRLETMVKKHGLHLHPGVMTDSQIFIKPFSLRLHLQLAISRAFDRDAIERHMDKHPLLKGCLKEVTKTVVDRAALEEILPTLPAKVANSIVQLQPVERMAETPLKAPQCNYCGGKLRKATKQCFHCGLTEGKA